MSDPGRGTPPVSNTASSSSSASQPSGSSADAPHDVLLPPSGSNGDLVAPSTRSTTADADPLASDAALLAPHRLRLVAFLVDAAVVAAATLAFTLVLDPILLLVGLFLTSWVFYHTLMVWLSGGVTVGKALCNLSVRRIDGTAPSSDLHGLAWAFGRATLGYLVVDVGGLGVLAAFANPRRRCLHDYVFSSEVVAHPFSADPVRPTSHTERLIARLDALRGEMEAAKKAKQERYESLAWLWKWAIGIPTKVVAIVLGIRELWRRFVQPIVSNADPASTVPAAQALSTGKIGAVVTTTSLATGAGVIAATTYLSASTPLSSFDQDVDGWTVVGDVQGGSAAPDYVSAGGNPGGFISAVDDTTGPTWYFVAPSKYLGDKSSVLGELLTFDLKISRIEGLWVESDVILIGSGIQLAYDCSPEPTTSWRTYTVPLTEVGWHVDTVNGAPATSPMFRDVLSDLTAVLIRGEFSYGSDTGSLDNVTLGASL